MLPFISRLSDPFGGGAGSSYDPSVAGTGDRDGNGFREGAVPILAYATDVTVRNAFPPYDQGPNGSSMMAGCMDAAAAMLGPPIDAIDAWVIGVPVGTTDAVPAMEQIAQSTGSYLDLNGNGIPDPAEWMVYPSTSYAVVDQVVTAIEDLTLYATCDVTLEATDPDGAVVLVDPTAYDDIPALNTVTFTLTLEPDGAERVSMWSDTVLVVSTELLGDGTIPLATLDLVLAVTAPPMSLLP